MNIAKLIFLISTITIKIVIIYLLTKNLKLSDEYEESGLCDPNYLTFVQKRYLSESSRNHMLEGARAQSILTCEDSKSCRLKGMQ